MTQDEIEKLKEWKDTLIEACIISNVNYDSDNPRDTLNALLKWEHDVALDPRISNEANYLITQGRKLEQLERGGQAPIGFVHPDYQSSLNIFDNATIVPAELAGNIFTVPVYILPQSPIFRDWVSFDSIKPPVGSFFVATEYKGGIEIAVCHSASINSKGTITSGYFYSGKYMAEFNPTHWMPIPQPPVRSGRRKREKDEN